MTRFLKRQLTGLFKEEDGPTAVEYAVMLSLIVGVCIASVKSLSSATRSSFDNSAQAISTSMSP